MPLRTIGQILRTYGHRPEHKSLGPDGSQAGSSIAGQLSRRPIRSGQEITILIGKEGNRLLERVTGEITDTADYRATYADPDRNQWLRLVLPILREIRDIAGTKYVAERVGLSDRQVRNWLAERDEPHAGPTQNRQRAERLAVEWATNGLQAEGRRVPADLYAVLYAYRTTGEE